MDALFYIGIGLSCLSFLVLLGVALLYVVSAILETLESYRADHFKSAIISDYAQISRWCGHEFPVLEHVMKRLIDSHSQGMLTDPSALRDELRRKRSMEGKQ